jgi:hypothetical protein
VNPRADQSHQVICEICGQKRRAYLKGRNICRSCWSSEPSARCVRCGHVRHDVDEKSGLCPRCIPMMARPVAVCTRCSRTRAIYNQEQQLCKRCNQSARTRQAKVTCSVCGKLCFSILLSRAICPACWRAERNGRGICSNCNKLKVYQAKAKRLCKRCYLDHLAPQELHGYVEHFTTPYPYNQFLFDLLRETIDWSSVTLKTKQKFQAFGHFLQIQQLSEPLNWETLEQMLPPLGPTNRTVPKMIRACLLEVGHLLAARGELESREAYIERRYARLPLKCASEYLQELLCRYVDWLGERRSTLDSVRNHLQFLVPFWLWCEQHGIRSPEEVQASLVNDYLLTLDWQWRCSLCQGTMEFDPSDRRAPGMCAHCQVIGSLTKERRYTQETVRAHRGKWLVFFDWLKINRMMVANPVQRQTPAPSPIIQHYPPEVIRQLCQYIIAPEADPVEALVLYLIIFHALSVWELQHVEIPTILTLQKDIQPPGLAEAYYVIVPKPAPSLGDRSPGRPDVRLDFPAKAASWLRPLLDRYERYRLQLVKNQRNRYLFITSRTAHRIVPVGHVFLWKAVRSASIRVLGAACNPKRLRITAGVMFADRAGAGVLRWMGWGEEQAFLYAWAPREVLQPKQPDAPQDIHALPDGESVIFPSPKESTYKKDLGL